MHIMRRIIPLLLLSAIWGGAAEAENITLYDMDGEAAAYIDTEDRNTIYLWSGDPAAYVLKRGSIPEIFGFNGRHLGWLEKGIVRDHEGLMAGFTKGSLMRHTGQEHYRPPRRQKPFRAQPEFSPRRPFYRNGISELPLASFLMQGRD